MSKEYREDLHEDMEVIQEDFYGWWKPRYLVDKRANTKVEFMSDDQCFCTVTADDIDWESLEPLDEKCKQRARCLDIQFPTIIGYFKNGVAEVHWQLNPDGRYYMDDDGFGMTPDEEVEIYGFIDRQGKVVSKFRHVNKNWDLLKEMRAEAEEKVAAQREVIDGDANPQIRLSKARLLGRTYGYCWVLLEKRDPEYDGEKLKDETPMLIILKATSFANEKELEVINKLVTATGETAESEADADPSSKQLENIIGALEGKLIEYEHLDPVLLLEAKEIKSKK